MTIQTEKEYNEALDKLISLLALDDDQLDDTIVELCTRIEKYEKEHFPIEQPSSWAMVEFHIFDRLVTTIDKLPISNKDKVILHYSITNHKQVPEQLVNKIKKLKVKDLL